MSEQEVQNAVSFVQQAIFSQPATVVVQSKRPGETMYSGNEPKPKFSALDRAYEAQAAHMVQISDKYYTSMGI